MMLATSGLRNLLVINYEYRYLMSSFIGRVEVMGRNQVAELSKSDFFNWASAL